MDFRFDTLSRLVGLSLLFFRFRVKRTLDRFIEGTGDVLLPYRLDTSGSKSGALVVASEDGFRGHGTNSRAGFGLSFSSHRCL